MSVDAHVSRSYQEELAERARENNAILAMDTGTGKTMIAAMVIRWKLAQEKMNRGKDESPATRKVALFLVPKVPLVEQQRSFLSKNMVFTIRGYTGAMGVDGWDRTAWQKEFMEADVLVMTSQIFLNILRHAHWTMQQVTMIVFDEVHNCRGRSAEAQIMMEHYHTIDRGSTKPKILGLTASPIFNVKQPVTALHQIQKLTDCTVYVVKAHTESLSKFSFQAEDLIVDYQLSPTIFPHYDGLSLWKELRKKRLLPNDLLWPVKYDMSSEVQSPESQWYRALQTRYISTFLSLGPFAADLFLFVHMISALDAIKGELATVLPNIKDPDAKLRQSVNATLEVLEAHQPHLATEGSILSNGWLSPKLIVLRDLLLKQDASSFRGVIFTHERQVATTLALLLPRLGVLGINAGPLVGHGQSICSEPTKVGMKGMSFRAQEHILDDFRAGTLNLLVATSVAEEGLDFPQCSFVCRFDPPRTLPQYIQSRGRARMDKSSFIIMLEEGPSIDRGRVEALRMGEVRVKHMYGRNMDRKEDDPDIDSGDEDAQEYEGRYLVEKTGASLTPAGAIGLLNNVCSLIPRDAHTPLLQPKYNIHPILHTCEVRLPSALPIPRDDLVINGTPFTRTKKAAKRGAAFNAVIRLHELGVFDEYLLPIRREKGDTAEDVDGKPPIDVTSIEPMMDVLVRDLWGDVWAPGSSMYLYTLNAAGRQGMGLVCANPFFQFQGTIVASRQEISLGVSSGTPLKMGEEEKKKALELMDKFTKHGIRYAVTSKGLHKPLSVFLVPVDKTGHPDWDEMEHVVHTPASRDWRGVDATNGAEVLVSLVNNAKVCKLVTIRNDLEVSNCISSSAYLTRLAASQAKLGAAIPEDDPVLQCRQVLQTTSTEFRDAARQKSKLLVEEDIFLPQSLCQWVNFSNDVLGWFLLLPPIATFLTSIFRARAVQGMMEMPGLDMDRTIEAFTLPSAGASFNNQRLETLGDAFLKLATSVHVFNKHPYKHEGQLTVLRQNSVSNRYLLGRGHARNLESFMNNEVNNHRKWRLTTESTVQASDQWLVKRTIPRRSVQDCMEALLGAAWLSGGVAAALEAGTKLGLCFGGTRVWWERYPRDEPDSSIGSPFPDLEEALGYKFKDVSLLIEALTHPSFTGAAASYQRLEFLGDAILDLVTMDYLFKKYPAASSGKLTRARARYVRNPTLSAIGTKSLQVHKVMLCDVISLIDAMNKTAKEYDEMSFEKIIEVLWKLDAPKAIGDVVEALLGAVFVDSGWDYDVANRVTLRLLESVLPFVHPDMPSDPTTEFMIWIGRHGCSQVKYRKDTSSESASRKDQMFVVVHDVDIGPPSYIPPKTTAVLARAMASLSAKPLLEDPMSPFSLDKVCNCSSKDKVENAKLYQAAADLATDENDFNIETVEGFATTVQSQLAREGSEADSLHGDDEKVSIEDGDDDVEVSTKPQSEGDGMDLDLS